MLERIRYHDHCTWMGLQGTGPKARVMGILAGLWTLYESPLLRLDSDTLPAFTGYVFLWSVDGQNIIKSHKHSFLGMGRNTS